MFLVVLIAGCKKEKFSSDEKQCIGDYEWAYSNLEANSYTITQSNDSDYYGIRIKENMKVEVYRNGKTIFKGIITEIRQYIVDVFILEIESNKKIIELKYEDGFIISKDYPFEEYKNYYIKH